MHERRSIILPGHFVHPIRIRQFFATGWNVMELVQPVFEFLIGYVIESIHAHHRQTRVQAVERRRWNDHNVAQGQSLPGAMTIEPISVRTHNECVFPSCSPQIESRHGPALKETQFVR